MPGVLLCCSEHQAHRGAPLAGVLLCRLACQALKGAPWAGSCSVVQCIRHLMGQPLYCSAADAGVRGERGYGDGSPPTRDSAVSPCFHGCLAFLRRHFPPVSSLISPRFLSLQSIAALALGLLHNPETPAPSCCAFSGTCVPVWGMYSCGKDCLILIPFRLPQISCFTLSLKCFSSDSDSCPDVGIRPRLQFPHPLRAGPALLTLLFSP